jgi:hypothetical protein
MNTNTMMPEVLPGGLLVLPQSFGNIYLGETFSSYVCVHNDSTEVGWFANQPYSVIIMSPRCVTVWW